MVTQIRKPTAKTGWDNGNVEVQNFSCITTSTSDAALVLSTFKFHNDTMKTITSIEIGICGIHGDGDDYIQVQASGDGGGSWSNLQTPATPSAGICPTTVDAPAWTDVTAGLSWTSSMISDANFQVRIYKRTVGGAGTIYLDFACVRVTYTSLMEEEDIIDDGWTDVIAVTGNAISMSPNAFLITPDWIRDIDGTEFTAAELTNAQTYDSNYVAIEAGPGAGQTVHALIMVQYTISTKAARLARICNHVRGCAYDNVGRIDVGYVYIWNENTALWETIFGYQGNLVENAHPYDYIDDGVTSDQTTSLSSYMDESKRVYVLLWNHTGEYLAEGCIPKGERVELFVENSTEPIYKKIEDVKPGDVLVGWVCSKRTSKVLEVIRHETIGSWKCLVFQGDDFNIIVTDNHPLYSPFGLKTAKLFKKDDAIWIWKDGKIVDGKILSIKEFNFEGEVYDLKTETENFFVNNVLVHNVFQWK